MTIGEQIKAARLLNGFTQRQLAEKLGITSVNISQIENNQRNPTHKTLQRIADALGIHVVDLIGLGDWRLELEFQSKDNGEKADSFSGSTREVYDELSDAGKAEFLQRVLDSNSLECHNNDSDISLQLKVLSDALEQLNDEGREKLLGYATDLVASGRYIKSDPAGLGKEA